MILLSSYAMHAFLTFSRLEMFAELESVLYPWRGRKVACYTQQQIEKIVCWAAEQNHLCRYQFILFHHVVCVSTSETKHGINGCELNFNEPKKRHIYRTEVYMSGPQQQESKTHCKLSPSYPKVSEVTAIFIETIPCSKWQSRWKQGNTKTGNTQKT